MEKKGHKWMVRVVGTFLGATASYGLRALMQSDDIEFYMPLKQHSALMFLASIGLIILSYKFLGIKKDAFESLTFTLILGGFLSMGICDYLIPHGVVYESTPIYTKCEICGANAQLLKTNRKDLKVFKCLDFACRSLQTLSPR